MTLNPKTGARGRPPRVTAERLRDAILAIEGEVPTLPSLARQLGVGVATIYSHVRGQDELRRLAADVVLDNWEIPPAPADTHWAHWLLAYARDSRRMIERYPVAHGTRPMAGGQLRHAERVLAQLIELGMNRSEALYAFHQVGLLVLGLGAQIEATRAEQAQSGLDEWGLLQEAFTTHPDELPVLGELERNELPSLNAAFDELVWFTLAGIGRRRGEVLPNQPPTATAP